MIRIIPPNTKQKAKIWKNITWIDLAFYSIFFFISFIVLLIKMPIIAKIISFGVINLIGMMLIISYGQIKPYQLYFDMMMYSFRNKKNNQIKLEDIDINFFENKFQYADDFISVLKLDGIDFGLYGEEKQDQLIMQLEKVFQKIPNGKIVKLDIPIDFSNLIQTTNKRIDIVKNDDNLVKILDNQNEILKYFNDSKEATKPSFFLLLFDKQENNLNEALEFSISYLEQIGLNPIKLNAQEINEFLKQYFDNKSSLSIPDFKEGVSKITFDEDEKCMISISQLGVFSTNGWLYEIFHMPDVKITMNFRIIQDKLKVLKSIDKSLVELEAQYSNPKNTASQKTDLDYKIESLKNLIEDLKIGTQELHDFQLYVMCDKDDVKKVLETFKNCGVYSTKLLFKQKMAYYDALPFLRGFNQKETIYNITTAGLAGTFPFISTFFMDDEGIYMGSNEHMIFFDLFKNLRVNRSSKLTRTNANMAILGKSGGGKSYFCKKLLLNERLDNCKIFILDPEDEYRKLAKSVDGNWIDIGGVSSGMINPFHVFPSLAQSDDEKNNPDGTITSADHLSQHRQFLESFFKVVIPEIDYETLTLLNKNIKELYTNFIITETTNVENLKAEDFPTFEDLGKLIDKNAKLHNDVYYESLYRRLSLILEDFRKGGLNSKLWNGHTTLKTDNKFTVLNFQSLFANNNNRVANGQMLVVMRYLMQEIIKNKNLNNNKSNELSKIIVQIDEAHQFIDPDFPVALKFMYQMIKRIRKYAGSMIVATQNIKDFIGRSEATRTQASAILNGCQYAMIFGLGADDLNSTVELYRSYNNGLTKAEQDFIANASQGEALLLVDSTKRNTFKVELYPGEESLIM